VSTALNFTELKVLTDEKNETPYKVPKDTHFLQKLIHFISKYFAKKKKKGKSADQRKTHISDFIINHKL
jgi:hypothetical protein